MLVVAIIVGLPTHTTCICEGSTVHHWRARYQAQKMTTENPVVFYKMDWLFRLSHDPAQRRSFSDIPTVVKK